VQDAKQINPPHSDLQADFSDVAYHPRFAVAVSGGSDSIALLLLAQKWAMARNLTATAITFDHGLRSASADEALWVQSLCKLRNIEHVILTADGTNPGSGIQAWARQTRYDAMTAWCKQNGFNALLTGHTLNDQAETVAMRQSRTDSPASLAGIWPLRVWNGVHIVRPLLGVNRDGLRQFLSGIDQTWLEDPSNDNMKFERVRVRTALLSNDIEALAAVAEVSRNSVIAAQAIASKWWLENVTVHPEGYLSFNRTSLSGVSDDVLGYVINGMSIALTAQRVKTRAAQKRLILWLRQPGCNRTTICGVIIARRNRDILFGREFGRIDMKPVPIASTGELLWDNRFKLSGPTGTLVHAAGARQRAVRGRGVPAFVSDSFPVAEDGFGLPIGISAVFCPQLVFS
jgi:tRNA(Ile)-lysidine synthase